MTAASPKRIELTVSGDPARPFSVEEGARRLRSAAGAPGGRESASMADSKHDARPLGSDECHSSFIRASDAQVRVLDATRSADTQSRWRTLTGFRPVAIDESASFIGSGVIW